MISQVDVNASGEIEFKEFVDFMTKKINRSEAVEELREALELFDMNDNGFIASKDLREAMHVLGERFSQKEIDEMIDEIYNDEEINIDDLITLLTTYPNE